MSKGGDDMVVNIAESPTGAVKPPGAPAAAPASAGARAKEWLSKPRNKWIAGGSLAALLLIPAVVVPAVVVTQKNNAKKSTRLPDWGGYGGSGNKAVYLDPLVSLGCQDYARFRDATSLLGARRPSHTARRPAAPTSRRSEVVHAHVK
jgi:hypothetical protein